MDAPEPNAPEEKLRVFMKKRDREMAILYIHGGGLYYALRVLNSKIEATNIVASFGSPAQYRAASARLAKMTKAPVSSIKHRVAPSHTFPAPILDTLVAYASLLYPPAGAPYSAVPANKIILAGISSGANLCFGLTKFLLELQKLPPSKASIDFHGRRVTLPLPAGISTVGGWCDHCDALPSWHNNGEYDFLGCYNLSACPAFLPMVFDRLTHPENTPTALLPLLTMSSSCLPQ